MLSPYRHSFYKLGASQNSICNPHLAYVVPADGDAPAHPPSEVPEACAERDRTMLFNQQHPSHHLPIFPSAEESRMERQMCFLREEQTGEASCSEECRLFPKWWSKLEERSCGNAMEGSSGVSGLLSVPPRLLGLWFTRLLAQHRWAPGLAEITHLIFLINVLVGNWESAGWYSKLSPFEVLSTLKSQSKDLWIPGSRLANDFTTSAETRALSVSMGVQRPPHTASLTKHLLCVSCLVPRCQESSLKDWKHPKPATTKEPMQLPWVGHAPASQLPASTVSLPSHTFCHFSQPWQEPPTLTENFWAPGIIQSTLRVLTLPIPKPHGNLLEGEKSFGPDSHMVSSPYF